MNRFYLYSIVMAAILMCTSCEKISTTQNDVCNLDNKVIPLSRESKEASYLLTIKTGHSITDCGGSCISINGKPYHVNCMGEGHVCLNSAAVTIDQNGSAVTATTTDTFDLTSEDFFLMPDRSLDYVDEKGSHIFLNIPEQVVYRDTATLQFTFTGLFFSEIAAYSNN